MSTLYFDSQSVVSPPSMTMVERLHDIDAGQRDAVTNVRASNGFRPESDTFCVHRNASGKAHNEAMEMGFAN